MSKEIPIEISNNPITHQNTVQETLKKNKLWLGIIIIAVLAVFIGLIYYLFSNPQKNNQGNKATTNNTSTNSFYTPPTIGVPIKAEDVIIKEIPIKIGASTENWMQAEIAIATSKGHYIVGIPQEISGENEDKIIYNGKTVFSSPNKNSIQAQSFGRQQVGISNDGSHYAYVINSGESMQLYLNGNKVTKASKIHQPKVSLNGDVFYISESKTNPTNNSLYKNSTELLKPDSNLSISDYALSVDGTTYLAYARSNMPLKNDLEQLYLNGKKIYETTDSRLISINTGDFGLSPNGKYYYYTYYTNRPSTESVINGKKLVDLKVRRPDSSSGIIQIRSVTDYGHFTAVNRMNTRYVILNGYFYDRCDFHCDNIGFSINQDASVILIYDFGEKWKVNGQEVDIGRSNGGIEIDGNTIYVYELTKAQP